MTSPGVTPSPDNGRSGLAARGAMARLGGEHRGRSSVRRHPPRAGSGSEAAELADGLPLSVWYESIEGTQTGRIAAGGEA